MQKKYRLLISLKQYLVLFALLVMTLSCNNQEEPTPKLPSPNSTESELGTINFKVTGTDEAQPYFEKGLLLLHSFEYEDARTEFVKAQEIDSTFAMAYWGEAMTYNHSLWQRQEKEKALATLTKFASDSTNRVALIKTELERDFFSAIELLYGEGTKYDRDVAYRDFMESLSEKYPNNHEVAAFYAISILGATRNGRDDAMDGKTARVAQSIINENPNHPGALHYLIHSYDDPEHAHLASFAADSYAKVAPSAAHALHMPSHIYVALGKWDEVVTSNIASWNASVNRKNKMELETDALSFHALNWMQYAFLQRGEVESATKVLEDMKRYAKESPTKVAQSYLLSMKGAHLVETNTWNGSLATFNLPVSELNLTKRGGHAFLEGMIAYHKKDKDQLRKIIGEMTNDRTKAMVNLGDGTFAMCSAGGFANKPANQLDIDMVHVMEMELEAYAATLDNNTEKAEEWFEEATKLDETLKYSFGPPIILKPVHEAYGEWLLENKKLEKALLVFEKSLDRHPGRLLSLQGKKKAAELLKNKNAMTEAEEELEVNLAKKKRDVIL
ncbi:MAG: tetratricopeptide repeat protein [Saprospiraceae bacterium]